MQVIWKIAFGIVAIMLAIRLLRYAKRVRASIKRLKVAESRIKGEATEIRLMDIAKVEPLGRQVLNENATLELWPGLIPSDIDHVLEKLDTSLQTLFRAHRKWFFPKSGTEFDAEYVLARAAIEGAYQIGVDKSIQHKLIAKPGSPVIHEVNEDDHVIEEYASIYHYFLLAEKD